MPRLHSFAFGLALASSLALFGCDPGGPGATGTISLAPDITTDGFSTLEIRGTPDDGKPIDFVNPPAADPDWSLSLPLDEFGLPFTYDIGPSIGSTPSEKWRMLAWLSVSGGGDGPKSGEPFGMTAFGLQSCGLILDDYCGKVPEVNFTIDKFAP